MAFSPGRGRTSSAWSLCATGARRSRTTWRRQVSDRRPKQSRKDEVDVRRLETKLDGPILVELVRHGDERGFFAETYRQDRFAEFGIADDFVQDNHSRSAQAAGRSTTRWSTCAGARRPTARRRASS